MHFLFFSGQLAEKCRDFDAGLCTNQNCPFVHTFKYCFSYQNTRCVNDKCLYMHCTSIERLRYESTGKLTDRILSEASRTFQTRTVRICHDFIRGKCTRSKCKFLHTATAEESVIKCPICMDVISRDKFCCMVQCNHILCLTCALRMVELRSSEHIKMPVVSI